MRSLVVQERRLHVGVHNGLGWVDGPQVILLEPRAGGSGGLKQSSTETQKYGKFPSTDTFLKFVSLKCMSNNV